MRYMETQRPKGFASCSDDQCPCGVFGTPIPQGKGYLYISQQLIDFRKDCLKLNDCQTKIRNAYSGIISGGAGVFVPILMCEQGARKRGLNLEVAAADARYWWKTGKAPLRPTPLED